MIKIAGRSRPTARLAIHLGINVIWGMVLAIRVTSTNFSAVVSKPGARDMRSYACAQHLHIRALAHQGAHACAQHVHIRGFASVLHDTSR